MVASQPRILRDEAEATAAEAVAGGGGVDCRFSLEMANERALERVFAAGCRPPASERAKAPLCFRPFFPFLSVQLLSWRQERSARIWLTLVPNQFDCHKTVIGTTSRAGEVCDVNSCLLVFATTT